MPLPTSSNNSITLLHEPEEMRARTEGFRRQGLSVGLVPTMGALHAGHLSLVRRSLEQCDRTVVTVFVNPTQFGPDEDYERYPRTLDDDVGKLGELGPIDVLAPSPEAIYPPGHSTAVRPPDVSLPLEGEFRPHHFGGVATVVLKLVNYVPAHVAFFGQKDYQQCRVIEEMFVDLNVPVRIVRCPIVREDDGLAMSSRNVYLDRDQRRRALSLPAALGRVEALVRGGEHGIGILERAMHETLVEGGVDSIDYAVIAHPHSLHRLEQWTGEFVALIAAHVGSTRLIDNLLWKGD